VSATRRRDLRRIVMLGTAFDTRGGISTVVSAYRAGGLFEHWPVDYVVTHRDGSAPRKLWTALKALGRFAVLLAAHQRVLVHAHCSSRASLWRKSVFLAVAMLARCPVVFHLHSGGFARFYEAECGLLGRWIVRQLLERAACVIAVSERWRDWLRRLTTNPRLLCIPNPVQLADAQAERGGRTVVLYLGRIEAAKGIPELLEAIAGLRAAFPGLELVCAGAGSIDAAATQAARLGIEDAVRFPGWIGPGEKRAWLQRAQLLVLPSHAEGLPMAVLEAMAAGLPVVASSVGGIPDVVKDGVTGCLVAPGDAVGLQEALGRLLGNPSLRRAMGEAGREVIRARYTPERVLTQLEQVYAELGVARATAGLEAFHKAT